MTNYEKIKQMNIDEMANFLCQFNGCCEGCKFYMAEECSTELYKWLKSEE